ncbi:MAG: SET domain-containing protein-lysine N-methyltransferase [Ferruginibacter sp.]
MTVTTHKKGEYKVVSRHGVADVMLNLTTHQHGLFAMIPFEEGSIIANFYAATTQNYPSYLTVQTAINKHITLEPEFLQFINHSCAPNVFFDTTSMQLVCIKTILPGDELCFFYPSTEWEMDRTFVCECGSKHCLQLIKGAAHIPKETLAKYRLTNFIIQQFRQDV